MIKKLFLFCLFAQLGGFDVLMAPSGDSIEDACRKKLAQAGYGAIALEKRNWGGDLNFGLFEFTQADEPYVLKVESEDEYGWNKVGFACVREAGLQDKIMVPERVLELGVKVDVYEEEEKKTVQSPAVALIMKKAPGEPFLTFQGDLEGSIPDWKEQCRACGAFLGKIFTENSLGTRDVNIGMFFVDENYQVVSVDSGNWRCIKAGHVDFSEENNLGSLYFFEEVASSADFTILDGLLVRLKGCNTSPTLEHFQQLLNLPSSFCEGFASQLRGKDVEQFRDEQQIWYKNENRHKQINKSIEELGFSVEYAARWISCGETKPASSLQVQ